MSFKSYHELHQELSADELYDGLLGFGLFSEQIPPMFSSENFLNFCKEKNPPSTSSTFNFIKYENLRNINIPRSLAIPNPIGYHQLCLSLKNSWVEILNHFEQNTRHDKHKISRIHIRKIKERKNVFSVKSKYGNFSTTIDNKSPNIFKMNHKNFEEDDNAQTDLLVGCHYQVKADISTFFPSIYTHSIGWALAGKIEAKSKIKEHQLYYNCIDFNLRNLRDGETHGILIGSHAFNLISEIILTTIDKKISQKYKFIRHIDDYTAYCETYQEAQDFLVFLNFELREYGLMLNHKKTEIMKSPVPMEPEWIREIHQQIAMVHNKNINKGRMIKIMDNLFEMVKKNNDAAILNYAAKFLSSYTFDKNSRHHYIQTMRHLMEIYPYLSSKIESIFFKKLELSGEEIKNICERVHKKSLESRSFEGCYYAIFFALKHGISIGISLFDGAKDSNDCILMIISYIHDMNFNKTTKLKHSYRNLALNLKDTDMDCYWLFVYEVLSQNDLKDYWKNMKKNKVSFISPDFCIAQCRTLKPVLTAAHLALPAANSATSQSPPTTAAHTQTPQETKSQNYTQTPSANFAE